MTVVAAPIAACIASTDVAQRAEPVRVRRRHVDEHRVERQGARPRTGPGTSERNTGTKSARPSFTACRALGPMNRARCRKCGAISGARWGPGSLRVEVDDRDVAQLRRPRDERVEQDLRGRGRALDVDLVAGPDPGDGFLGR